MNLTFQGLAVKLDNLKLTNIMVLTLTNNYIRLGLDRQKFCTLVPRYDNLCSK